VYKEITTHKQIKNPKKDYNDVGNIQLFRPILKDVPNRWIKEDKK